MGEILRALARKTLIPVSARLAVGLVVAGFNPSFAEDLPGIQRVQDRPEFRSYERIPGLQLEGVPVNPPRQRGVRRQRPETVMPTPVAPRLRRPGAPPKPFSSLWYSYCDRTYRSFEPRTGHYTTYSGEQRFCR